MHLGAPGFLPVCHGKNGCQSDRRRHWRRSDGHSPVPLPPHLAPLCYVGKGHISLFGVDAAGWRSPRNVRISRGATGGIAITSARVDGPVFGMYVTPDVPSKTKE